MRAVVMVKPGEVEVRHIEEPKIEQPTDAVIRLLGACICGSDLWPYRGLEKVDNSRMGHEYVGVVEQVGSSVTSVTVGDVVIGSFCLSCGQCDICKAGYPSRCIHGRFFGGDIGTQAEKTRLPLAQHSLVAIGRDTQIDSARLRSYTAASDVLGTGWFGADAAHVRPGKKVLVVGDGAVGLMAVLAAKQMGAEQIIVMSRYRDRQELARSFGATHVVEERGEEGIAHVKDLTDGLGAHSVIEAVGLQQSMDQAIRACRPGGHVGFVGVSHDVSLSGSNLFFGQVYLHGGPAPVRRYLPDLIEMIDREQIDPGKVFTMTLPLSEAARGYEAMDRRETVKVFLDVTK